jgi:hypothetical protein
MTEAILEGAVTPKFVYQTFGPFKLTSRDDLSSQPIANDFWDELDDKHPGLRSAIGIYIFSVQATKRSALTPWYVGKTEDSFERRFRGHRKLFEKLLNKNGSAVLFLIAKSRRHSKEFMGVRKVLESNDVLETMLIERCLDLNPKLFNASKTKYVKGLVVPGFRGKPKGRPDYPARQLKQMLGSSAHKEI